MSRLLEELERQQRRFSPGDARHTAELLSQAMKTRFREPADLVKLHETALFLRAYPASARVKKLADQVLLSFRERLRGVDLDAFEDPEISGIVGTSISTNFSFPVARSLAGRHPKTVSIDWQRFDRPDRLGAVLARLAPLSSEDGMVEAHPDYEAWARAAQVDLRSILAHTGPDLYDSLEIPVEWKLTDFSASRSGARLARGGTFFHTEPLLKRSDVSIAAAFAAPRTKVRRVPQPRSRKILALILDTSATRYRELHGFSFADPDHLYHADLGRGVDVFLFGVTPEHRLPLRAYHAAMFFIHGVPAGYFEGLSLFERMEAGFNLYHTFREGETAWIYAQLLKLFREQCGTTCFSVDPYQVGHQNEEAISSGAFWFYRKLGFRAAHPEVADLVAREEARIAADPGYRTPPATLRRLAVGPLIFGGGPEWDQFDFRQAVQSASRFPSREPWHSVAKALRLPERAVAEIVRAKRAPEEVRYLRLLQRDSKLRAGILRLGTRR